MAKWEFKGLDEYVGKLKKLDANTDEIIGRAIYAGAGVVADAVRQALNEIQTDDKYHPNNEMRAGPTTEEKKALLDGFGISKLRQNGTFWNVKIGFSGRNPSGIYNSGLAKQIESGTSWMAKQPFMARTINRKKQECEDTMRKVLEEEIEKLTG